MAIKPVAITSSEAFGTLVLARGSVSIIPSTIESQEVLGISTIWSVVIEPVHENFDLPGFEESWILYTGSGSGLIYPIATTVRPSGCGTHAMYVWHAAVTWACYAYRVAGYMPIVYCRSYVMLGGDTLATGESAPVLSGKANATAAGLSWQVRRYKSAGGPQLFLYYTSGGVPVSSTKTTDLDYMKWYCIEVKYDTYNNSFFFKVDGITIASGSLVAPKVPSVFIYIGSMLFEKPSTAQTETYYDFIRLNTISEVGIEPGLLLPVSISSSESFGTTTVIPSYVLLFANPALSEEAFGTLELYQPPDQPLVIEAIISEELFGTTSVVGDVDLVQPTSIVSVEAFGTAVVVLGAAPLATEASAIFFSEYITPPRDPVARVSKDLEAGESITLTLTAFVPYNHFYQLQESAATVTLVKWTEQILTVG